MRVRAAAFFAAIALFVSAPAFAYRPFDGTDAAVTERGQLEIEFGPLGFLREGADKFLVAPAIIANYGFAQDMEVVLEGRNHYLLSGAGGGPRLRLLDNALSLKTVVRPGDLQEQHGFSVATEISVLLPTVNDEPGIGAQAAIIVSRELANIVVHINGGIAYNRAHNVDLIGSVILEGPFRWTVRPVFELFSEDDLAGPFAITALVGAIWRESAALAFDAGIRVGRDAGSGLVEGRLGLTFAIDLLGGR